MISRLFLKRLKKDNLNCKLYIIFLIINPRTHKKVSSNNKYNNQLAYIAALNRDYMKGSFSDFSFKKKENEDKSNEQAEYSKKPLLLDPSFYNNVSKKIQDGFCSSFQLADETYSNSTSQLRNKIRTEEESENFYNKNKSYSKQELEAALYKQTEANSNTKKPKKTLTNKIVSVDLFAKQKENDEIESYKKFNKNSPVKKKKKEPVKKNLDNLFLDERKKKSEYENTKVNLLTDSALLDFKLNIKKTGN